MRYADQVFIDHLPDFFVILPMIYYHLFMITPDKGQGILTFLVGFLIMTAVF